MEWAEKDRREKAAEKRERRKVNKLLIPVPSAHICNCFGRNFHAFIGLASNIISFKVSISLTLSFFLSHSRSLFYFQSLHYWGMHIHILSRFNVAYILNEIHHQYFYQSQIQW